MGGMNGSISSSTTTAAGVSCGFIRIYNDINDSYRADLQFGNMDQGAICSVDSNLQEVMSKCKLHPNRSGNNQVRVAKVQMKNGGTVEIMRNRWMNTTIGFLLKSAGIIQGEILEIRSGVIDLQEMSDAGNISE
jgi:hypothetical protein